MKSNRSLNSEHKLRTYLCIAIISLKLKYTTIIRIKFNSLVVSNKLVIGNDYYLIIKQNPILDNL